MQTAGTPTIPSEQSSHAPWAQHRLVPKPLLATDNALAPEVVRRHRDALQDKVLQRFAHDVVSAMQDQLATLGVEAIISAALESGNDGLDPVERLKRLATAYGVEAEAMTSERHRVYMRTRALRDREKALLLEVSRRRTNAIELLPRLRAHIASLSLPAPPGDAYRRAIELGVPEDRLRDLHLAGDPEPTRAARERLQTQLAQTTGELEALDRFMNDRNVMHLAGMGMDDLVASHLAAKDLPL